jgi:hypothetical protein
MEITVADAARGRAHQHLMIAGIVDVNLLNRQRLPDSMEYRGFHNSFAP